MKQLISFVLLMNVTFLFGINKDTTLITIGDQKISLGEFEYLHDKNNQVVTEKENSIDEYLEMFINFKLKVKNAEDLKMDTATQFIKELQGYRKSLAQPYLTDQDMDEKLLHEAYDRLKEEVEASHILIQISSDAPQDTLKAYNKAIEARNKIIQGEAFDKVAKEYSTDPSVAQNGGYLGFFSGFQMVLPFETAAYNTPVGEVSMPARSRFGYHIIKVHSRRPSMGQIKVSHILLMTNDGMDDEQKAEKKEKAFEIYHRIEAGEDFAKMAKEYSDDHGTAPKGGEIGYIRSGQTIPPFEKAAYALKENGDVSEPVQTRFGWHIIRLEDRKGVPSFDEEKNNIKKRLARDKRGKEPEEAFLNKLKEEYHYTINQENLEALYAAAKKKRLDSTLRSKISEMNDTIITFGDQAKLQSDLAKYTWTKSPSGTNFESLFSDFEKKSLIDYEDSRLEEKYPEFKYLINEYHDGLLLFEISNQKVWGKASSDEEAINKFYKKHKKDYRFDDSCFGGTIIYLKDSSSLAQYDSLLNLNYSISTIKDSLNTKDVMMKTEQGYFSEGDNKAIDYLKFNKEKANYTHNILRKQGQMYSEGDIKPLAATRGAVISDYQDYLEKKWVKALRKKYKIKVDKDLLSTVEQ